MSDYIDRDLILTEIEEIKKSPWYNGCNGNYERIIRSEAIGVVVDLCIKQAPAADAVEVIRCQDCKYPISLPDSRYDYSCSYWNSHSCMKNDFCSYGKRKDGGIE